MDMTDSIEPKSDQMNAEDLLSGPRTLTVTEVRPGSGDDQPVFVYFAEFPKGRPFKPSKTVRRLMVLAWGIDTDAHVGKRMTLYRDPEVRFGGKAIGGIRVSHMSGIGKTLTVALATTRGQRGQYVVDPIPDVRPPTPVDALVAAFAAAGVNGKEPRLAFAREVTGRQLASANDLTPEEVEQVITALHPIPAAEPRRTVPADGEDAASRQGMATLPAEPDDYALEPSDAERAAAAPDA